MLTFSRWHKHTMELNEIWMRWWDFLFFFHFPKYINYNHIKNLIFFWISTLTPKTLNPKQGKFDGFSNMESRGKLHKNTSNVTHCVKVMTNQKNVCMSYAIPEKSLQQFEGKHDNECSHITVWESLTKVSHHVSHQFHHKWIAVTSCHYYPLSLSAPTVG